MINYDIWNYLSLFYFRRSLVGCFWQEIKTLPYPKKSPFWHNVPLWFSLIVHKWFSITEFLQEVLRTTRPQILAFFNHLHCFYYKGVIAIIPTWVARWWSVMDHEMEMLLTGNWHPLYSHLLRHPHNRKSSGGSNSKTRIWNSQIISNLSWL